MPAERLLAGEKFSIEAAFVERELSRKVGDISFSTPVSMRNEWSTIRLQHKVPGSMLNKKLAVGIPIVKETAGGKLEHTTSNMWMHNVEWEFEQTFSDYKNNAILLVVPIETRMESISISERVETLSRQEQVSSSRWSMVILCIITIPILS